MRRLALLVLACCSAPSHPPPHAPPPPPAPTVPPASEVAPELAQLREGGHVRGYTVAAVYLDDADQPVGAKLVHDATGFQLDYLRIESAPQGYLWGNSHPTSDQGEPHTQEHLLLGKGNRGRRLGSSEAMALATSTAFTEQWHTAYLFHTVAGADVYWSVFENELAAAPPPDYTDEEIRREVRNFGLDKGGDGTLHLEEKGTVYNEMVRAYEDPEAILSRTLHQLAYGAKHPLALESGGFPAAIRTMTPQDIRKFHDAPPPPAPPRAPAAFPSSVSLATVLDQTSRILTKEAGRPGKAFTEAQLAKPAPAPAGTLAVVEYPYAETTSPGPIAFIWPATRHLDTTELLLARLFLASFAGDESTPLYKQLIDSKTHAIELGATALTTDVSSDLGEPATLEIEGVKADKLDTKTLGEVRTLILAQLARLAQLPDNDPELLAFDRGVQSRLVNLRRELAKFLDSPPGFGYRGIPAKWHDHLHLLAMTPGFAKSLTLKPELAAIDKLLAAGANPRRDRIKSWGLLDAPYGVAAKPSPALRKQRDDERTQRNAAELARLEAQYKLADPKATLARYQTDYDAATRELEAAQKVELPPLVASPPMTLDASLKYETGELGAVRTFTATFDSMQRARVQLSFDINRASAPADQMFLAGLPELLSQVGVIDRGAPITSAEMKERLRKEVLGVTVSYIGNNRTLRNELAFTGSGLGAGETKAALGWIQRVVLAPDWRIENLARLRDVVEQTLTAARARMLEAEETWVDEPRDAWRHEDAVQAHTASYLTQIFDLHRLRWMLEDTRDAQVSAETIAFLNALAGTRGTRAALVALTPQLAAHPEQTRLGKSLSSPAQAIARDAGKDLGVLLGDLPDTSLASDWAFLCHQMAKDLAFGAPAALAKLEAVRAHIIHAARARIVETGSTASQRALAGDLQPLVAAIPTTTEPLAAATPKNGIRARLAARIPAAKQALFVGLYAPSTSSGVFENLAPAPAYADDNDNAVLDYLASNLYTGHGGPGLHEDRVAAGLAYSNGLHPFVELGILDYFAERCPLLPQTLRFVIDQLKRVQPDPYIARYAIAGAFASRVADGYERRAAAMAANLVDGQPPDMVRAFRTRVLAQSQRPDLAQELYKRMPQVYGKVLPGFGATDHDVDALRIDRT